MIRIDELYNNTFWSWFKKNKKHSRIFFCDPPGHTAPTNLFTHTPYNLEETLKPIPDSNPSEFNYYFFHDQEPIHLDIHGNLFNAVKQRSQDIYSYVKYHENVYARPMHPIKYQQMLDTKLKTWNFTDIPPEKMHNIGNIISSETNSVNLDKISTQFNWTTYYYFYHGWASLDWYRGYNKTFLIPRAINRSPTKTFISPNRIIGGKRNHRVLFLYHIIKNSLNHNYVSAPKICPEENVDITEIAKNYIDIYPDIVDIFNSASLPYLFKNEDTQLMSSCWITNFDESANSLFYVPTETLYFGRRWHLTEKTFKPIVLEMPFILVAPAGSLEYLRSYGFKTFGNIIDESYDKETDDILRLEKISKLLTDIDNLSAKERQQIHKHCLPLTKHNFNHFYGGDFENILWQELTRMMKEWL